MRIAVQCASWGDRCGISTYTSRFIEALNKIKNVEAFPFVNKFRGKADLIVVQYEPGMCHPQQLQQLLNKYIEPIVLIAHHNGLMPNNQSILQQFYPMIDGIIFHSENQIIGDPWNYKIIKHPAIVFPERGKDKMRAKYGLPKDKKIIGTMGFIAGTGKKLPDLIEHMLRDLNDDEFLYLITSFWKGGDFGNAERLENVVKRYNKEKQFRLDTDFASEKELNEKMQCCDLLFSWNISTLPGGTSGAGMDMLGARRKVIVKDVPHYEEVSNIPGVEKGRKEQKDFAEDVLKLLRTGNLDDVPDPEPYSWDNLIKEFYEYFQEIVS